MKWRTHLDENVAGVEIGLTPEKLVRLDAAFPPGAAAGEHDRTTPIDHKARRRRDFGVDRRSEYVDSIDGRWRIGCGAAGRHEWLGELKDSRACL